MEFGLGGEKSYSLIYKCYSCWCFCSCVPVLFVLTEHTLTRTFQSLSLAAISLQGASLWPNVHLTLCGLAWDHMLVSCVFNGR